MFQELTRINLANSEINCEQAQLLATALLDNKVICIEYEDLIYIHWSFLIETSLT